MVNRKERFATEGFRLQRHNPDGTMPTPQRFIGFANTVDLSKFGDSAPLTIKVDSEPSETKVINFSAVANIRKVTVDEAINALMVDAFTNVQFSVDEFTGRLKGAYTAGAKARVTVSLENIALAVVNISPGLYTLIINGQSLTCIVNEQINLPIGETINLVFTAVNVGVLNNLPSNGGTVNLSNIIPTLANDQFKGTFTSVINGTVPESSAKKIQVVGELAAALDFGQGLRHGGNGLEIISFFDDETISIGLPKDIKDKEEIDIESAKGSITRMVIGAMLQGMSPVMTVKVKDYELLELIQGGKLDRKNGIYDPPLSNESDPPTFYGEIFSAIYSSGSNKISDVAGYEKILLRSMIGMEGDVPTDAKSWATYAYNMTATEYTDENNKQHPAWQEQSLTTEQFDALKVKEFKIAA